MKSAKVVAHKAQDIVGKGGTAPNELGNLAREVTTAYSELATNCRGALATADDDDVSNVRFGWFIEVMHVTIH